MRYLVYERFCLHGDKGGVLQLQLDKWQKNVVLRDKTGKFYDESHQSNGAAEKAVSTVLGLAGTYLRSDMQHGFSLVTM